MFRLMRNKQEKRVSSGQYVDLANFKADDVNITDITRSLNMQRRFTGHYKDVPPLSVAQHTLLCTILANMLFPGDDVIRRAVIIHDFAEAYTGDIITPIKRLIGHDAIEQLTKPIDDAIYQRFWPYVDIDPRDVNIQKAVKICDYLSLDIERRVMWRDQTGKAKWPPVMDIKLSLLDKQALFNEVKDVYVDLENLLDSKTVTTNDEAHSSADVRSLNLFAG